MGTTAEGTAWLPPFSSPLAAWRTRGLTSNNQELAIVMGKQVTRR